MRAWLYYVREQKRYQELEYRDFGVHITGVVRFNEQNLAQVNSANKTFGIIRRIIRAKKEP